MRFYLTFELEKSSLPKDYRRIILSYIKVTNWNFRW